METYLKDKSLFDEFKYINIFKYFLKEFSFRPIIYLGFQLTNLVNFFKSHNIILLCMKAKIRLTILNHFGQKYHHIDY